MFVCKCTKKICNSQEILYLFFIQSKKTMKKGSLAPFFLIKMLYMDSVMSV